MDKSKPFLLSITLYSVLILQAVLLIASGFILFLQNEMAELQSFFYSEFQQMHGPWFLYSIILLVLVSIFALIQMLRRKLYGIYIFNVFSIISIIFILMGDPIDFLNIFVIVIINYVFYMHRSWFALKVVLSELDADEDTEVS